MVNEEVGANGSSAQSTNETTGWELREIYKVRGRTSKSLMKGDWKVGEEPKWDSKWVSTITLKTTLSRGKNSRKGGSAVSSAIGGADGKAGRGLSALDVGAERCLKVTQQKMTAKKGRGYLKKGN